MTSGYAGFQDFTRTSASLVNAGGFLIPLFALILGVFSFVTHPEYLELLVTQPVPRFRVLLGQGRCSTHEGGQNWILPSLVRV